MTKLQDFYNARVARGGDQALAHHVGHTLGGAPLPAEALDALAAELWQLLALDPEDDLLDLCCGNGLFSRRAAAHARSVTGVDFSSELIRVAQAAATPERLRFLQGDAMRLPQTPGLTDRRYSKVLMNASLQHFAPQRFAALLDQILSVTSEAPVILLSHTPERGKERALFDTPKKRLQRAWLRVSRRDVFGHWWRLEDVAGPAAERGLVAEATALDAALPYAHYRVHLRLRPALP